MAKTPTLSFSTIYSAVKPKDRSPQYAILAGLYCLDAHRNPVTAKAVTALLKLHLGRKTPENVNASLRAYTAYVEAADPGPPPLWSLTPKGLEHLRSLSGLALSSAATDADFDTDIGIICALEQPEFEAVARALGGPHKWKDVGSPRFPHVYRETTLVTNAGKSLRVIGTTSTSMGLTAAAIATTHLTVQYRPRFVAMIGIAAGTRGGDKEFGDVLIADPSVDYNSGKVVDVDGIREFLPDPYPIGLNPRLRSILKKYRSNATVFDQIRVRYPNRLPPKQNRVHIGPLGAADQVIDDPSIIVEIQRNWRKLIGVEMETYGVYRACLESPKPEPWVASFKAVCDFAAEKTDSWQHYAAFVAAEFTVEFLKAEWESLWPA